MSVGDSLIVDVVGADGVHVKWSLARLELEDNVPRHPDLLLTPVVGEAEGCCRVGDQRLPEEPEGRKNTLVVRDPAERNARLPFSIGGFRGRRRGIEKGGRKKYKLESARHGRDEKVAKERV